jgi:O-antigen ligase
VPPDRDTTETASAGDGGVSQPASLTFGEALFLVSCFMAPVEIKLVASFTVYDLITAALFLLVLSRGVTLPSPGILASGLVFLFFALLSTLRSPRPDQSLTQILQYLFIFFVQLPVLFAFARSRPIVHAALLAFIAGSLVPIADAYLFPKQLWSDRVSTRFSESPNRLGYPVSYLAPFVGYFVLGALRDRRWRLPVVSAGALVSYLLLWALTASGSRGAAAATLGSIVLFLGFRRGFSLRPRALFRLAVVLFGLVLCGTLLYRSGHFPQTLGMRIERTLAVERTLVHDRTLLAIGGLRAFAESPLLGLGLDNFRFVADRYVPTLTQQNPHNLWIQLLAHTGIIGTLGFLGVIVGCFGIAAGAQRRLPAGAQRELLWALLAAMSATMVIFFFIPILIQRQYWWIFGMALSVASIPAEGWQSGEKKRKAR